MGETMTIDLLKIANDYIKNFNNRKILMSVAYVKIPEILIKFETNNLPHILGLHYVTNIKPADKVVEYILDRKFSHTDFRRHKNYSMVKERIENYNFLHDVFYKQTIEVCIIRKDIKNNSMNLDIVFFKDDNKRVIVLGLRMDMKTKIHYPTTLHVDFSKKYKSYRQTKINSIKWID